MWTVILQVETDEGSSRFSFSVETASELLRDKGVYRASHRRSCIRATDLCANGRTNICIGYKQMTQGAKYLVCNVCRQS